MENKGIAIMLEEIASEICNYYCNTTSGILRKMAWSCARVKSVRNAR